MKEEGRENRRRKELCPPDPPERMKETKEERKEGRKEYRY
jgi:hypothetical protein